MDFNEVIKKRKSIRKYDLTRPVSDELVNKVLETARLAPSACNLQPWHFIVIRDNKVKEEMKEVYGREWFYTAPVIIVGCTDTSVSWKRSFDKADYSQVDLAIAFDHLLLAAAGEGLGTCWIGAFNPEIARKVLGIPEKINIIAMTPLGYPAEVPAAKPRKELKEIIHEECW
ncbi:MAG: nitroreductase family protein [Candidatus Firestonebacteria bacterium]